MTDSNPLGFKEIPKIGCISVVHNYREEAFIGIKCSRGRGIIFPGGKWEPGETFKETVLRELKEETLLEGHYPELFFSGMAEDGYYVYAFKVIVPLRKVGQVTEEGETVCRHRSFFLESKYRGYYELMFDAFDKTYRR